MASSFRPSVHSPVHRQRFSKLVPPCTTVLKTHTVADGLSSVEAVMTQFRHDRLWRMSSTRETSSASNNYRADSLNHRLMKSSCASARSLQASLVCSERSVTRRNETLVSFKKTEPKGHCKRLWGVKKSAVRSSKAFLMWPLWSRSHKLQPAHDLKLNKWIRPNKWKMQVSHSDVKTEGHLLGVLLFGKSFCKAGFFGTKSAHDLHVLMFQINHVASVETDYNQGGKD